MIGFLYRFFIGRFSTCEHTWETLKECKVYADGDETPNYISYHLRCTKCGDMKCRKLG